jgi:hypothetical protein
MESPETRRRTRRAARRRAAVALATVGAVFAVGAGCWAGARLRVSSDALRLAQGPHLYLQGRNYPPPAAGPARGQDALEPAAAAAAPGGGLGADARPS